MFHRFRQPVSAAFVIILIALLGVMALRGGDAPRHNRDIHLTEDSNYGETVALMRFPLELSFAEAIQAMRADPEPAPVPFLLRDTSSGNALLRLNQEAYEDDFDGFIQHLLKDYRFSVAGQEIVPELGILSMVAFDGAEKLPPGFITTQSILGVCTAFPGRAEMRDIEVVLELYLPDTSSEDAITITTAALPTDARVMTHITDHRGTDARTYRLRGADARAITLLAGGT